MIKPNSNKKSTQNMEGKKNIQHQGFAGRHRPNY